MFKSEIGESVDKVVGDANYGTRLQCDLLGETNRVLVCGTDIHALEAWHEATTGDETLIGNRVTTARIAVGKSGIQRNDLIAHVLRKEAEISEKIGSVLEITRVVRRPNAFHMFYKRLLARLATLIPTLREDFPAYFANVR